MSSQGECPAGCGRQLNGKAWRGYCNPCYKRLFWRPVESKARARDRASSREAKRRRRAAGEKI